MKLEELIERLQEYKEKYGGHVPVDLLIESRQAGQVEAHLSTTAVVVKYRKSSGVGIPERVVLAYEED